MAEWRKIFFFTNIAMVLICIALIIVGALTLKTRDGADKEVDDQKSTGKGIDDFGRSETESEDNESDLDGDTLLEAYQHTNSLKLSTGVIVMTVFLLVLVLSGIYMINKENTIYYMVYAGVFAIGTIVIFILGGCAASSHAGIEESSSKWLLEALAHYWRPEYKRLWDHWQISEQCCGVYGADDWMRSRLPTPLSCCGMMAQNVPIGDEAKEYPCNEYSFHEGCQKRIMDVTKKKLSALATCCLICAFLIFANTVVAARMVLIQKDKDKFGEDDDFRDENSLQDNKEENDEQPQIDENSVTPNDNSPMPDNVSANDAPLIGWQKPMPIPT